MRLDLKTVDVNPLHRWVTIFVDGRNVGELCLSTNDADEFLRLLLARGVQLSTVEHDGWTLAEDVPVSAR